MSNMDRIFLATFFVAVYLLLALIALDIHQMAQTCQIE